MPQTRLHSDTIDTDNITSMVEFMFQLKKKIDTTVNTFSKNK